MVHTIDGFGLPVSHEKKVKDIAITTAFPSKVPERPFIPTEAEWKIRNNKIINISATATTTTATLYTVPANKVFYLAGASILFVSMGTTGELTADINATRNITLWSFAFASPASLSAVNLKRDGKTINLGTPLRFEEGDIFSITKSGANTGSPVCAIYGWEEDKPIS